MIRGVASALAVVILRLGISLAKLYSINREGVSPLECGFNSKSETRTPISLRFFIFAVVFVIFDVELVLVLPVLLSAHNRLFGSECFCVLCTLLGAGLYLE